jgi:transcriptional regulator with XRE-family HTH domain
MTRDDIYDQLAQARRRLGLKQAELGKILGLPQSYISQVEAGKHDIKINTLLDWAKVLHFELMLIPKEQANTVAYFMKVKPGNEPPRAYEPLPEI